MSQHQSNNPWHGTERELAAMTRDLDDLHHDVSQPAMRDGLDAVVHALHEATPRSTSRRNFLRGAGVGVLGGVAALAVPSLAGATARGRGAGARGAERPAAFPPAGLSGDIAVAAVAASLENLAVFAYTAGIGAATAGKLGSVPPAVVTFATTARSQHTEHAAAWNAVLRDHHRARVTEVNPTLAPVVKSDFASVHDVVGLAKLALTLETIAAETYQAQISRLVSPAAVALAASIEPVEMQHVAILYYVLGEYPGAQNAAGVPLAFSSTAKAQ